MKLDNWQDRLRLIGLILLIVGYAVALNQNLALGLTARIVGAILVTPFGVHERIWDFVAVNSIFCAIDIHSLIRAIGP